MAFDRPMRPSERRDALDELDGRAVCRDRLSSESFEQLEQAESFEDLQAVLLDIFEPSGGE